jgi:hypothetical protein
MEVGCEDERWLKLVHTVEGLGISGVEPSCCATTVFSHINTALKMNLPCREYIFTTELVVS